MQVMKKCGKSIMGMLAMVLLFLVMIPAQESRAATGPYCIQADGSCQDGSFADDMQDNYYFQIKEDGWVRIGVSSSCSSAGFQLYKDSNYTSKISTDENGYVYLKASGGTAVDYFIKVSCSAGHSCTAAYSLSVNYKASSDVDPEPNDSRDQAISLISGEQAEGTAYKSANDADWYKFEVKSLSMVHIALPNVTCCSGYLWMDTSLYGVLKGNYNGTAVPYTLVPGTYYIQIIPSDGTGGNYRLAVTIVEYPTVNDVTKVQTTGVGRAKVTWSKSNYADGYFLFKKSSTGGSWVRIANIPSGKTTSYVDTSAPLPGSSCIYGVQAYKVDPVMLKMYGTVESSYLYNQDDSAGKLYQGTVPTPKNVKATKSSGCLRVKWGEVSGAGGYRIYRKANGGSYKLVKNIKSGSTVSWKDTSAEKGTYYTYKVRAYYAYGTSTYYSSYSAKAEAKLTGTISAPKGAAVKNYTAYNKVTWNSVSGASGYKVYRKVGYGSYELAGTTSSKTLTYKDKAVKNGRKYTYKVKAFYKNYTYNSSKDKYTSRTVNSAYSKAVSVKR